MKHENVMVIETASLGRHLHGKPSALIRDDVPAILELIEAEHFFVLRADAEVEPKWRQVIPYVIVTHGDETFTLQRTVQQSEARLHNKFSIGIGGHVNPGHDVRAGLEKELHEEVAVAGSYELELAGILNDESTEVGRVHLGVVYLLRASSKDVQVIETDKMTGGWRQRAELAELYESMESWSQLAFDALLRA